MLRQILFAVFIVVTACTQTPQDTGLFAPDIDPSGKQVNAMVVGERLMDAGEYELALDAFTRAAASDGFTGENLSAMGVANFGLGRMDQALAMFERALKIEPEWPGLLNNYGIAMMAKMTQYGKIWPKQSKNTKIRFILRTITKQSECHRG